MNNFCLFLWVYRPTRLSSEGSLACHTYCDTGHPIYNVHLRGPVTLAPIAERLGVQLSLLCNNKLVLCRDWDSNTEPSDCGANALTHYATSAAWGLLCLYMCIFIFEKYSKQNQ